MREIVRRVGQRFMIGFDGLGASAEVKGMIRSLGAGHVILFARNVDRPEQVADLVRELQGVAREAAHERPLLVAVDQEGGRVARLREPWTLWPPARIVGRAGSEELVRRVGEAMAAELSACGIHYDCAPVLDVDSNPMNPVIGDRSFGEDPEIVGRLGVAFVKGLQSGGVAAAAKHFPGHGDTALDSHLDLPRVEHDRSRLEDVELRPFRRAVEAGVASVMTAHLLVPALDEALPATLSPRVVGELLRKDLGFGGVVVSDDLEMKAIAARWRPALAAVYAAKAGCDILSVCARAEAQAEAMEAVIRAVESGEIVPQAMDDADGRIRRLKERFACPYGDPDPAAARRAAGAHAHVALALEIGSRAGIPA
jgi:beta-N-acetylhexosaminidase